MGRGYCFQDAFYWLLETDCGAESVVFSSLVFDSGFQVTCFFISLKALRKRLLFINNLYQKCLNLNLRILTKQLIRNESFLISYERFYQNLVLKISVYITNKFISMKSRSGSEPRLRQTYTPRIKDGRYSNENSPMKNNYMTEQKQPQKKINNPQTPKNFKNKRPHSRQEENLNIKQQILETAADSPVKRLVDGHRKVTKFQERKQETYNGRKLEYPHPSYRNAHNNYRNENINTQSPDLKMSRSQSAQLANSRHFVDRSKRSRERVEKHMIDEQKMKVAINYLLENNEEYLEERIRMCNQKAKPKEQIFKIKLANTPSTYKEHYPPKDAPYEFQIEPQNEKTALSLGPRKVCGNSTNNEIHNGVQGPRADLATWPEGFKLQGPIDGTTTYANKFPDYGDYEKMVPIATFNQHPMGFAHKTNSTYRSHFTGKHCPRSDIATWNNLHPYGNDFNPDRGTHYGDKHGSKQKQPIQQWPMYDPRHLICKGKFSTEYKSEMNKFNDHELNYENQCRCGHCGRQGKKRIYK